MTTTPDPAALEAERARIREALLKPVGDRSFPDTARVSAAPAVG